MASEHVSNSESKQASDIYSSSSSSSSSTLPDSTEEASGRSKYARAEQIVAKACWWVRRHPEEWAALKRLVRYLEEEGDIVQRGNLYALAQRYGIEVRLRSVFKRDHNLWSVLARYMAMERPALLSAIRFRETPVDRVPLAGFWRDIVGEDEFVAGSLAEARAIHDVQRGA